MTVVTTAETEITTNGDKTQLTTNIGETEVRVEATAGAVGCTGKAVQ